ncbi:Mobile element protein (plasmid) [Sinorhizobium sp. CCBAU 05631]|nr:Mobile element protein [Sinorhizobium sp. CCBAU 05631]
MIDPPATCACCGGSRLSKLGEDVTETLEEIPRRFKVIETVREKFTCRDCEAISQPPAPFHATPCVFIGPHLLATILSDKFGMHSPLNRQSTRFKREGIELSTSTLADQVGYGTAALLPIFDLIETHAFAAERLLAMTPQSPFRPKTNARPGEYGPTCAMTGPTAARQRRRPYTMRRAIAAASIRRSTWPNMAALLRAAQGRRKESGTDHLRLLPCACAAQIL